MHAAQIIIFAFLSTLSMSFPIDSTGVSTSSSTSVSNPADPAIPRIPKYSLGFNGAKSTQATKTATKRDSTDPATPRIPKYSLGFNGAKSTQATKTSTKRDTTSDQVAEIPSSEVNVTMSEEARLVMDALAKNTARGAGKTGTHVVSWQNEDEAADRGSSIAARSEDATSTPLALRPGSGFGSKIVARSDTATEGTGFSNAVPGSMSWVANVKGDADSASTEGTSQDSKSKRSDLQVIRAGSKIPIAAVAKCQGRDFLGQPQICG